MGVEQQKGQQAPQHRPGEHAHLGDAPPGRSRDVEQGHGHGDGGGQAVQAVGDVHRVHRPHDDEGGEDHVDRPAQGEVHIEEGDVQVGSDVPLQTHQHEKEDGRRQLEQELLDGREAQVLMALYLLIVVQEADDPEDGGKEEQVEVGQISRRHAPPSGNQDGGRDAGDEHKSPHGRGPGLGGVPLGAHIPDLLAGLQPAQGGQDDPPAQNRRYGEAQHTCSNHFHKHILPRS